MPDWGLLLVNLGTPDAPETGAVRRYLREFLSDPRVIDIHPVGRALLLYGIILPFRSPKSAEAYRKIWTDEGSPLLVHGRALTAKVQDRLGAEVPVALGMRYQSPSLESGLRELRERGAERVVVAPLYPQYSTSATESSEVATAEAARAVWGGEGPELHFLPPFYEHPGFIDAFAAVAAPVLAEFGPDRVMLSFHGLPERQIRRLDGSGALCLERPDCCDAVDDRNRLCYRAHSYATARALAAALGLADDTWEVAFQSRLGRTPWIRPYTDVRLLELAAAGTKRLAVLCPAFVADCLETLEEIGIRARADFRAAGGEDLVLVPSLNAHEAWVDGLLSILADTSPLPVPAAPAA